MNDTQNQLNDNYFSDKYGKRESKFSGYSRLKLLAVIIIVFAFCYWLIASAPADFPKGKIISIPSGTSLLKAGNILEQSGIIRSPLAFRIAVRFFAGSRGVKAGNYLFENPQNVVKIAKRLTDANRGFAPLSVVIPEGTSVKQIAEILSGKIPNFNKTEFIETAFPHEGYLFPDTYHFSLDASSQEILNSMLANFDKKITTLQEKIDAFGRPLSDVINMASIIEEEGRTTETRQKIAGILWKRLDIDMPLQVDAAFGYLLGRTTFELATSDLETDSPYNTYTRRGLPPTPITNPGMDSILATITPIKTPYLFYLTGKDGKMYYAATHDQHVVNKERYLK
ncbi:MAG TPA: endolytic transglycosylase MltG [Candidatus Paceibacterota bacterium]